MDDAETIFAVATGAGRAAIAIVRITGPGTAALLDTLCHGARPAPRRASLRKLWHREDLLDRALVLWFPAPRSYTGEDGAELHVHAGHAVIEAVADALTGLGARPAEPGEFTRRAFCQGRIDLLEAEGIADLIDAETQAQRRQALWQTEGALSRLYDGWALRLRRILAHQEALIDFPDEDLPAEVEAALLEALQELGDAMTQHLAGGGPAERLRRGLFFAVIGAPNMGKSSLVNALAQRDAAIIAPMAGTTRDALEIRVVFGDVPVTLVDTAGLRETGDAVEAEGVRRALMHAEQADLVIRVIDPWSRPPEGEIGSRTEAGELVVCNKTDQAAAPSGVLAVSALSGAGMPALVEILCETARRLTRQTGAAPLTRARHRAGITAAAGHLAAARHAHWPELRGEELRLAMRSLGRLTGAIGVEDLLDTVFGQFCIGK